MYSFNTVNKPFTATVSEARPVSHLAAAVLLGTSIFAVHKGAEMALTGAPELALVLTAAIVGMEWVQWTSLGRISKLEDAGQHTRAGVLKLQCMGIGILQTILYTIAVLGFAKAGGADWGQGWSLFGCIGIAACYAGLNFIVKWTSCETVEAPAARTIAGPTGGTRAPIDEALFGKAPVNAVEKPGNVMELKDRVKRERDANPFGAQLERAPARKASKGGFKSEWAKAMADHRWEEERKRRVAGT